MSIQLSLFWKTAEDLTWHWQEESQLYHGTLEEMIDQKKRKNLHFVTVRLFLPDSWFSILNINVPPNVKRITDQILRFAAEEYLAQDIDLVHLVLLTKSLQGEAAVLVTEEARFQILLSTLTTRGFHIEEAYDSGWYSIPENQTEDVLIVVGDDHVTLRSGYEVYRVHPKGFSQWFALWSDKHLNEGSANILVISRTTEGVAKSLVTELEVESHAVNWVIQDKNELPDWNDQAASKKGFGNLITAKYNHRKGQGNLKNWMPSAVAAVLLLTVWVVFVVSSNIQTKLKLEQTWVANENIFLQVFGKGKKIQRPLMVREMRQATLETNTESSSDNTNAITILNDIKGGADPALILEDFRFSKERNEAFFTLFQSIESQGDAFNRFESLKTLLESKGYTVENSASKERDGFKAKFKSVKEGRS